MGSETEIPAILKGPEFTAIGRLFLELDTVEDLRWHDLANCQGADPDLFFPARGASTRIAKSICRMCAVRDECLEYAVESSEKFGIWGAMSERERRKIRVERADIRKRVANNNTPTST